MDYSLPLPHSQHLSFQAKLASSNTPQWCLYFDTKFQTNLIATIKSLFQYIYELKDTLIIHNCKFQLSIL